MRSNFAMNEIRTYTNSHCLALPLEPESAHVAYQIPDYLGRFLLVFTKIDSSFDAL